MTDDLIQSNCEAGGGEMFRVELREGCRSPVIGRYSSSEDRAPSLGLNDLKHSKSDDLILQSAPLSPPEMSHGISEASLQIQREACVLYEQDLSPISASVYFSDSETLKSPSTSSPNDRPPSIVVLDKSPLKGGPSRRSSQFICDRVDPEDSIRDTISENDFYRFVLFKSHYEKYLDISKKCEEARNISYYLEEKYHEIKVERDNLNSNNFELERRLERKEAEMHEKEDELFIQLEKAIRLEEDYEKVLKTEKEKIMEWKDRLEKEKNELYKKLRLQVEESEANRRRIERARNDVVQQVTEITADKDLLKKENKRLRDAQEDIEQRTFTRKNKRSIEKELMELKLVAKQSATLNSQLKKGMKHLASCRRRKCPVCAYTRSTFGQYTTSTPQRGGKEVKLFSCQQGELGEGRISPGTSIASIPAPPIPNLADELTHSLSQLSLARTPPDCHLLSYIDDCSGSTTEASYNEDRYTPTYEVSLGSAPHAFSSDSGFSSGDPSLTPFKLIRRSAWTSSFRKLIRKVSKRHLST